MDNFEKDITDFSKPEAEIIAFEDRIKYFPGIDTSNVSFDHKVPFTNDDLNYSYEPDGRDLAEIESQMEDEYKQQKREEEDEPF